MAFLKIKQQTPAWHKQRAKRIGASEASALFRIDQPGYAMSAYTLRMVKRGEVDAQKVFAGDREQADLGLALEPVIAERLAKRRGWIIKPGGYAYDDKEPHMGASLDYIIDHDPRDDDVKELRVNAIGKGVLQIKSVIGFQYRRAWEGDRPPEYVRIQLQQEMAVTGFQWGFIGVLVNGTELKAFPVVARPEFGDKLRSYIGDFWRNCIEGNRIPPIDGSESSRLVLRAMHAPGDFDRKFTDMRADLELNQWAEELHFAQLREKAEAELISERKNQIVERITTHSNVRSAGYRIQYSVSDKQRRLTISPVKTEQHTG